MCFKYFLVLIYQTKSGRALIILIIVLLRILSTTSLTMRPDGILLPDCYSACCHPPAQPVPTRLLP